jgi:hypothetical protein
MNGIPALSRTAVLPRLALATLLGALVGLEREHLVTFTLGTARPARVSVAATAEGLTVEDDDDIDDDDVGEDDGPGR